MKLLLNYLLVCFCFILQINPINAAQQLDSKQFVLDVHESLKNTGHVIQLQEKGKTTHSLSWGWAKVPKIKNYKLEEGVPWGPLVPMHIASISKLITTIALTKLINDMQDIDPTLGFDSRIINYLPAHWKKGPNIDKIRFCDLLTHKSGFSLPPFFSHLLTYESMKAMVMMGISRTPNTSEDCSFGLYPKKYDNTNFALLRIIMPIIQFRAALYNQKHDYLLDLQTQILHYQYMQDNIFKPAGVYNARTKKASTDALGYQAYVATYSYSSIQEFFSAPEGFNSGSNMNEHMGSAGWHLSINNLLKVMSALRRSGKYMTDIQANDMLVNGYGIDQASYVNGWLYAKYGFEDDSFNKSNKVLKKEQAVVYFLPNNRELAIYVNSPIPQGDLYLLDIVENAYTNNIN